MKITDKFGKVKLSNGLEMPYLGLGVYKTQDGPEVINSVKYAFEAGYRHVDTAAMYMNEKGVGTAVKESNLPREALFITSKLWNDNHGFEPALKAYDESLKKLGTDYLDLYLVHWPVRDIFKETWRAFEKIYKEGRVKAIGVSNFLVHQLEDLLRSAEITPMVNQVEFHPYSVQQELLDFCRLHDIQFEAWAPLMQGRIFNVLLINELAKKYNRTAAQITLRWNLQKNVVTIPKSVKKENIISNSQLFDFELSAEDVLAIDGLDKSQRFGAHPDHFDF
jgi:methylglyoxal/glyoxal reductase